MAADTLANDEPKRTDRRSRRIINQLAQLEAARHYREARCALSVEFYTAELHGRAQQLLEAWTRQLGNR